MTDELTPTRAAFTHPVGHMMLHWEPNQPASLISPDPTMLMGRLGVGLVEVFTAHERRRRTSQAFFRSAVGERLRVTGVADADNGRGSQTTVTQRDAVSGLEVRTTLLAVADTTAIEVWSEIHNRSDGAVILTDLSIATVGFAQSEAELDELWLASARSEWLAENRWTETPLRSALPALGLPLHGQDGRGHFSVTSHGAWSTGEHLPNGIIVRVAGGDAFGWEIRTSSDWMWDLTQTLKGGVISFAGPTDAEHHFMTTLGAGQSFRTPSALLATSHAGRDGVIGELTRARRVLADARIDELPVIYNDFMNTLMGQPSTEALTPLIDAAAECGAEYFCIDAGWFADPDIGDWWTTVGEWREAPARFSGGLHSVIARIHARGMRSGLWLEPEVVGVDSATAARLPDDAFFKRFGERVQEDRRYHLDLRHPAAREHLDRTVDHLVATYGVSFFKLDYNINPGPGTSAEGHGAGFGLLEHTRALREWLNGVRDRHPHVLIENCSSGGMRADQFLLSATHLQSTSDQQNYELYPPIAASAPASIRPEQSGNWAYPSTAMTLEETAFTLVTGLSGRLYLSGFLDQLSTAQQELVKEATTFHKTVRGSLLDSTPFWPLGLPGWDDETICLGLRSSTETLLFVWDRSESSRQIVVPTGGRHAHQVFPASQPEWVTEGVSEDSAHWTTPAGRTARVFRLT